MLRSVGPERKKKMEEYSLKSVKKEEEKEEDGKEWDLK